MCDRAGGDPDFHSFSLSGLDAKQTGGIAVEYLFLVAVRDLGTQHAFNKGRRVVAGVVGAVENVSELCDAAEERLLHHL